MSFWPSLKWMTKRAPYHLVGHLWRHSSNSLSLFWFFLCLLALISNSLLSFLICCCEVLTSSLSLLSSASLNFLLCSLGFFFNFMKDVIDLNEDLKDELWFVCCGDVLYELFMLCWFGHGLPIFFRVSNWNPKYIIPKCTTNHTKHLQNTQITIRPPNSSFKSITSSIKYKKS